MFRPTPSAAYELALASSKHRHAAGKTFSGSLMRPFADLIKNLIVAHDCKTVLDYGCGKGKQYEWVSERGDIVPVGMTIEEHWGLTVTKYDPAYPMFSAEPRGKFDLVVCTNTLGVIPIADLPWVIDRLYSLASKALFISEQLGRPSKKLAFSDATVFPRMWTEDQWHAVVHREGSPIHVAMQLINMSDKLTKTQVVQ